MPTCLVHANGGNSFDSLTSYLDVLPEDLLLSSLRPPLTNRTSFDSLNPVSLDRPTLGVATPRLKDPNWREEKIAPTLTYPILHNKHTQQIHPIADALRHRWAGPVVELLSVVMSRTGTPHTSTISMRPAAAQRRRLWRDFARSIRRWEQTETDGGDEKIWRGGMGACLTPFAPMEASLPRPRRGREV
jgi:hypothetical protein